MQGMIAHHAQALAMTALLPARTTRPDMLLLAQRIEVSQRDEIALMRQWLLNRHEQAPDSISSNGVVHGTGAASSMSMPGMAMSDSLMPGMLTPAQLSDLAAASGPQFDRLFLEDMIRHHQGALYMVGDLMGSTGAAQDTEIFRFATDVDADQRAEIARMRAMLARSSGSPR
jgi:uncharacterized protein (DUF305 family)